MSKRVRTYRVYIGSEKGAWSRLVHKTKEDLSWYFNLACTSFPREWVYVYVLNKRSCTWDFFCCRSPSTGEITYGLMPFDFIAEVPHRLSEFSFAGDVE